MKKEYIIPIFVPHLGCPNDCVFCNQKKIAGKSSDINLDEVRKTIEFYLENLKEEKRYVEIAFFGGSFTGIEENLQNELLEIANEYIKLGKVNGIRISTRPDLINRKNLKKLKKYHVKTIELGVQTTNDYILKHIKRNHTYEDVKKASKKIRWHGFRLGHQMMIGLPESTEKDEINTARNLIKLKPKLIRIYPVLVIKGTELVIQYSKGEYTPLTVEQAVERSKRIAYMFKNKNINIIRIGLQNTEEIDYPEKMGSQVIAGPYHPAFRQLVEDAMWYDILAEQIKKIKANVKKIEILVNEISANNVIGHKRENINKLQKLYDIEIYIKIDEKIKVGEFKIKILN